MEGKQLSIKSIFSGAKRIRVSTQESEEPSQVSDITSLVTEIEVNNEKFPDSCDEVTNPIPDASPATIDPQLISRCNINKWVAMARKNLRTCERIVQESEGKVPALALLLVEDSWKDLLKGEFRKPYFTELEKFVSREASGKIPVYPPMPSLFRAYNSCPLERVKAVIIGQDPYHGQGQAMGLCFSVPPGIKIPSSLQNIFKEAKADVGLSIPSHGNLEKWAAQGVLLLNTVLTVRESQANSHAKKGWEVFTDATIRAIANKCENLVFLLWGAHAQEKGRMINEKKHLILKAPHPSGLSAHRGFIGCKHFSQMNLYLQSVGKDPIDWQL